MSSAAEAYSLGTSYFVDEDYEEALAQLNKAIDLDASNAEYFDKRAAVHLKLGSAEKALADEESALAITADKPQYHLRKGLALFELERFKDANEALKMAQTLDKESSALPKKSRNQLATWLRKCEAELEDDDEAEILPEEVSTETQEPETNPAPQEVTPVAPVVTLRHAYYQVRFALIFRDSTEFSMHRVVLVKLI